MPTKKLAPVHPGEILLEDFLKPLELSQYRVAKGLGVPPRRINEIILGKRAVSADTALRLARFFGTSPRFWLNLQIAYDLDVQTDRLAKRLQKEVKVLHRARSSKVSQLGDGDLLVRAGWAPNGLALTGAG